jgi:segregation and condensation protein A
LKIIYYTLILFKQHFIVIDNFMIPKQEHFTLANFEGSLDFLICLIQKEEIDIYDVSIQGLIQQFLFQMGESDEGLDRGAEFIGAAAYLVWLKSKTLLPRDEQLTVEGETIEDPHFEIIHHLIDYCRFKQAAKELASRQEKQQACYFRGIEIPEWKKPLGIHHVSLEELSTLFKEMMGRAEQIRPRIEEENWRVCDKIGIIRRLLQEHSLFSFSDLFSPQQSRAEMIVIFLAILELMKIGELAIIREESSSSLSVLRNYD